jgi:hypothetical protein
MNPREAFIGEKVQFILECYFFAQTQASAPRSILQVRSGSSKRLQRPSHPVPAIDIMPPEI